MLSTNDVQKIVREEVPDEWTETQLSVMERQGRYDSDMNQVRIYDSNERDEWGFSPKCCVTTKVHCGFNPTNDEDYDVIELNVDFMNWDTSLMITDTHPLSPTENEIASLRKRIKEVLELFAE